MARIKKATAKKAAPKKMGKRPAPKKQAPQEELAPVPTQQNPQPPMGTPPMGANGPMMRKGGKIKKAQNSVPSDTLSTKKNYETSPYTKAKQDKQNKENKYKNLGGETGNPIFTDKEQTERRKKLNLPTSKAEEKAYYEKMRREGAKSGKTMKKAQGGTKFAALAPPFNKATYADKIAGATKGEAKNGTKMKMGGKMAKQAAVAIAMKNAGKTPKKAQYGGKAASMVPPMKNGGGMHKMPNGKMMKNSAMKSGGKMKTCKGGC